MSNHKPISPLSRSIFLVLIGLVAMQLAACAPASGAVLGDGTSIQIVQPLDGAQFALGETIEVVSNFGDAGGATGVILQISPGATRADEFTSPVAAGSINQVWQPLEAGTYTLQAYLSTSEGLKIESNAVQIIVGEAVDSASPPAVDAAATPTPTPLPATLIAIQNSNCRFGPDAVFDVAGGLGGGQSALALGRLADDSWWLIEDPDGVQCWIFDELVSRLGDFSQVPVVAAPSTPTPTPTPVPLLAPSALSPSGSVGCVSSVFLTWDPVSHPNGIDHYEWQVSGAASDSGATTNTQVEFFVACSASYEWSVRAVDNGGNASPYSVPLAFDTN